DASAKETPLETEAKAADLATEPTGPEPMEEGEGESKDAPAAEVAAADATATDAAVKAEGSEKAGEGEGDGEGGGDEGVEPPASPASVGEEPPAKKSKTDNGTNGLKVKAGKTKVSGDPSGREIFVDNLPPEATEEQVKAICEEKGGTVGIIRVMLNKEGKCRGLAVVRFMERESAIKAMEAIPGTKMGDPEKELGVRKSDNSNTLFIGNLNKTWTKEMVQTAFEEKVEGVVGFDLTMDAMNKDQNRGFGFATFESVEACRSAHAKYHKDKLSIL
ncbi:unnamed protein product, partial [Discosporangium mesarthrocarpum]